MMQAFTLIELMVALAIIAVLYTLAKPRYNNFIATARRAEAQNMLAHIGELQQAYRQEEGNYYFNNSTNSSNADINQARKYGRSNCHKNGLYFHVEDCDTLRYQYWIAVGTDHGYVAIAHSKNDNDFNNIYPGCTASGGGTGVSVNYSAAGTATTNWTSNNNSNNVGDMFVATDRKGPELYIDVIEGCQ